MSLYKELIELTKQLNDEELKNFTIPKRTVRKVSWPIPITPIPISAPMPERYIKLKRVKQNKPEHKGIWSNRFENVLRQRWHAMHQRSNEKEWVTICADWSKDNPEGFQNFYHWALNNDFHPALVLDKDKKAPGVIGDLYSPARCSWLTCRENTELSGFNNPSPFKML